MISPKKTLRFERLTRFIRISMYAWSYVFMLSSLGMTAQTTFQLGIGTDGFERGIAVKSLAGDGFIIAGNTQGYGLRQSSMLLVRTDVSGNIQWSQSYGSLHREIVSDVIHTPDGGFIVLGEKYQLNRNQGEFLTIFKTDKAGNLLWSELYDEGGNETEGFTIKATQGGDYIVSGLVKNIPAYNSAFQTGEGEAQRAYLLKIDGKGKTIWSRSLNTAYGGFVSTGLSVVVTNDDSYIVTGNILSKEMAAAYTDKKITSKSSGEGAMSLMLAKLRDNGALAWVRQYGANKMASGAKVIEKKEGGYLIAGMCTPHDADNVDFAVISVNAAGNVQWSKTYGGDGFDSAKDVVQTPDGGFVVSGETSSFGSTFGDILLFKIDNRGTIEWAKTYGGKNADQGGKMTLVSDGIVFTGGISLGVESMDILLIKIDWTGKSNCQGTDVPLTVAAYQVTEKKISDMEALTVKQLERLPDFKKAEVKDVKELSRQVRIMKICN